MVCVFGNKGVETAGVGTIEGCRINGAGGTGALGGSGEAAGGAEGRTGCDEGDDTGCEGVFGSKAGAEGSNIEEVSVIGKGYDGEGGPRFTAASEGGEGNRRVASSLLLGEEDVEATGSDDVLRPRSISSTARDSSSVFVEVEEPARGSSSAC